MIRNDDRQTQLPLAVIQARFISQLERDTPQVVVASSAILDPTPTRALWHRWVRELLSYDINLERAVLAGAQMAQRADASHLSDLYALIKLDDPFVMGIVIEPVARLHGVMSLPLLLRIQRRLELVGFDDTNLTVITRNVIQAQPREAYSILVTLLHDPDISVRRDAVWAMGFLPPVEAVSLLLQLLRDAHKEVRIAATYILKHFQAEIVVDALVRMLHDPDPEIRCTAIDALQHLGDKRALSALENARRDRDATVRAFAKAACQKLSASIDIAPQTESAQPSQPSPPFPQEKNALLTSLRSAILSVSGNMPST